VQSLSLPPNILKSTLTGLIRAGETKRQDCGLDSIEEKKLFVIKIYLEFAIEMIPNKKKELIHGRMRSSISQDQETSIRSLVDQVEEVAIASASERSMY